MPWTMLDFNALPAEALDRWRDAHSANPAVDSPFFHPAFAAAVNDVYGDVQVATLDGGATIWFPVQTHRGTIRPVGWPGADFEGPIATTDTPIEPLNMLRDTGMGVLRFDHLLESRHEFEPWVLAQEQSPFIDATGGLDGYLPRISDAGRRKMSHVRRTIRKATRELGEVRLVWHSPDPVLVDWIIDLKRTQYADTGEYDYFASPRRRQLVHQLARTEVDGFSGVVSALYAGDTLLAAHIGLRAGRVLHYWFPVYVRDHSTLGPGLILLSETIAAAPHIGIDRIDLGKGDEAYKYRIMTGATSVYSGEIVRHTWRKQFRRTARVTRHRLKDTTVAPQLLATKNRVLRMREGLR